MPKTLLTHTWLPSKHLESSNLDPSSPLLHRIIAPGPHRVLKHLQCDRMHQRKSLKTHDGFEGWNQTKHIINITLSNTNLIMSYHV